MNTVAGTLPLELPFREGTSNQQKKDSWLPSPSSCLSEFPQLSLLGNKNLYPWAQTPCLQTFSGSGMKDLTHWEKKKKFVGWDFTTQ